MWEGDEILNNSLSQAIFKKKLIRPEFFGLLHFIDWVEWTDSVLYRQMMLKDSWKTLKEELGYIYFSLIFS